MVSVSYCEILRDSKDPYHFRVKLVEYAVKHGIKAATRQFSCSRNTVRKWLRRWQASRYQFTARDVKSGAVDPELLTLPPIILDDNFHIYLNTINNEDLLKEGHYVPRLPTTTFCFDITIPTFVTLVVLATFLGEQYNLTLFHAFTAIIVSLEPDSSPIFTFRRLFNLRTD